LGSILGLIFETLEALISGHPVFVPKLTLLETAAPGLPSRIDTLLIVK
jgi:hypothetical protein